MLLRRFAATVPIKYVQGQVNGNVREYFYYINHEGMLFLDDARMKNFTSAYKDVDFLNFFYKHLRENETGRFEEHFPYLSRCGRERNLLRCDDRPIVFTKILDDGKFWRLGESTIKVEIEPSRLFMLPNGRLYHPAPFGRYGLVKSAVADLIFPNFEFDSDGFPVSVRWNGRKIELEDSKHLLG